jgi:hypothetical protein
LGRSDDLNNLLSGDISTDKAFVNAVASGGEQIVDQILANKSKKEQMDIVSAYTGIDITKLQKLGQEGQKSVLSKFLEIKAKETQLN